MKKFFVAAIAALSITALACTSVDSAKVDASTIASNGEAVAVVQAVSLGLCLIFHFVPIASNDLDTVINKVLITEAKALGGSKVELLAAGTQPTGSILFQLTHNWIGFDPAMAVGIAVK